MSLDPNSLLMSLLVSSIGFVCFVYGKKQERVPQLVGGLVLMVYPYFVSNPIAMAAVGVAIGSLVWVAVRLGM